MSSVLVVGNEASIRNKLSEFLILDGIEIHAAADSLEALRMIDQKDYDVILMDIVMPNTSAIELLMGIRQRSERTHVIVMTDEPTEDIAVQVVKSGANDYLLKPITQKNLKKAVDQAIQIQLLYDQKLALLKKNITYQKDLEKIVKDRTIALRSAMQSIIYLLSSVTEIRDPYTAGHQIRVGNLAAAIAKKMQLDAKTINYLRLIGYIHDIGKTVIPIEILSKPGRLNDLEMQMIRTHPLRGYEMLKKVDLPDIIGEAVLTHHERCDGSGYPRALISEEIGKEAHILIVADVVEAMLSHRPYRPALGLKAALCEIVTNSGKLYKPLVVTACVSLFSQDHYEIEDIEQEIDFLFESTG